MTHCHHRSLVPRSTTNNTATTAPQAMGGSPTKESAEKSAIPPMLPMTSRR